MRRLFPVLFLALLALRVPSLVQPAGNDQGLYAYVGRAIAHGEVPYRDAWDQKPPAVHFTYAAMYALWPHDSVVPLADLVAATAAALLLIALGRRLTGSRGAGETAALLFLFCGNPSFLRLGGMWVRAQCETFIAVLTLAALLLVARATERRAIGLLAAAGLLLGVAFLFKYNAVTYLAAAAVSIALSSPAGRRLEPRSRVRAYVALIAGFAVPLFAALLYFLRHGALIDLFHATITYNARYSGETYRGVAAFSRYLLAFPVRQAAIDSLWLLGGAGCAVLIVAALRDRQRLLAPAWVAAACLAIAINSARGLPQYFVQANAWLALAAGLAAVLAWKAFPLPGRLALIAVAIVGVARVSQFDNLAASTRLDVQYWRGAISRTEYLGKFANNRTSALAAADLGEFLKNHTQPSDRIFVFGFSGNVYVHADRLSASRFFWSRPVLAGFNEGIPGYGAAGVLNDLAARRPAFVVLQQHDWPAEGIDSATYFTRNAGLYGWLQSQYEMTSENDTYRVWRRR